MRRDSRVASSGSDPHSRVGAAIWQPVFLAATSTRRRIIPHRAHDRCAAILSPLLSLLMFPSTLRAGPGRQQLYGKGGSAYNHDARPAGPDNTSSAGNEGNPITLGLLIVLGGPRGFDIIVISALS